MAEVTIEERIALILYGALAYQNGFVREDKTVYMGSAGSVDVVVLAHAIKAGLGLTEFGDGDKIWYASEFYSIEELS